VSGVAGDLVRPIEVEPYGPADGEQAASRRRLARSVAALGRRCAQYVVADSLDANVGFLHDVGRLGLHAVARLKANLPTRYAAAQARFAGTAPRAVFTDRGQPVEVWDADDFAPRADLRWPTPPG
jgi:hypothetical protein